MSYDLMVFDPAAAPSGHAEFMKWYEEKWEEPQGYDPSVCTPGLRALLSDIVVRFPALNGPLAPRELPEDEVGTGGLLHRKASGLRGLCVVTGRGGLLGPA
jgi:hypothetical protein